MGLEGFLFHFLLTIFYIFRSYFSLNPHKKLQKLYCCNFFFLTKIQTPNENLLFNYPLQTYFPELGIPDTSVSMFCFQTSPMHTARSVGLHPSYTLVSNNFFSTCNFLPTTSQECSAVVHFSAATNNWYFIRFPTSALITFPYVHVGHRPLPDCNYRITVKNPRG